MKTTDFWHYWNQNCRTTSDVPRWAHIHITRRGSRIVRSSTSPDAQAGAVIIDRHSPHAGPLAGWVWTHQSLPRTTHDLTLPRSLNHMADLMEQIAETLHDPDVARPVREAARQLGLASAEADFLIRQGYRP